MAYSIRLKMVPSFPTDIPAYFFAIQIPITSIPPPLPFAVSMIPIPAPVTTPPMMIPMTGSSITAVAGDGTIEVNKLIPTVPRIVFIKKVFPILNHAINKIGMLSSK